jgi:hypothetical protein
MQALVAIARDQGGMLADLSWLFDLFLTIVTILFNYFVEALIFCKVSCPNRLLPPLRTP